VSAGAHAQLIADIQVHWTSDYTTVPYGTTCSSDQAVIGGGYCTIHVHLPGWYPVATIGSLTASAPACRFHGGQNVAIGGTPAMGGPCPPGCTQSPYTTHWDILWPISNVHNVEHTIHVAGTCSSPPPFGTSYTFEGDATFTISNLIVMPTQPVNPEPILWHGDQEELVSLRAEVSSAYKAEQAVKLRIYDSDQVLVKTIETTSVIGPGASQLEFEWNGSQDPPREGVAPRGIYLFRWEIGGAGPTMDYDQDKSVLLAVTDTRTTVTGYDDMNGNTTMTDGAVFTEQPTRRNASQAHVRVYDDDVQELVPPTLLGTATVASGEPLLWNEVTLSFVTREGYETHLFSARDDRAADDRGHRQRWALQRNQRPFRRRLYVMIDPGHGRYRVSGHVQWRRTGVSRDPDAQESAKLHEDDSNLALAQALKLRIEGGPNSINYQVRLTRTTVLDLDEGVDATAANEARCAKYVDWLNAVQDAYNAKQWTGQIPHMVFVSIHTNSDGATSHGTESFYRAVTASHSQPLAQAIHNRLVNDGQRRDRQPNGVVAQSYTIFSGLGDHAPASLTEVLFHSNTDANGNPAPVGGAEFDLLRDGLDWTVNQDGGGTVSYTAATWWGYRVGAVTMRRGIVDYFAAHPDPP